MPLNEQKGNMYEWVTHTWNIIKGACPHDCTYCYMKRFPQKPLYFDKKELKTNFGYGKTVFVGSSCDCFAESVPDEWIEEMFDLINGFNDNKYLFQSKNPDRMSRFEDMMPVRTIVATTLETNRNYPDISKAPSPEERYKAIREIPRKITVTIEPVMDFDSEVLLSWLKDIKPLFVSIGANSRNDVKLPEPSTEKLRDFIKELSRFTTIKEKRNLARLY